MHIKNDICYADKKVEELKVIECKPLQDEKLLLIFSNGERKLFDCKKLNGPVFKLLKDEKIFNNVKLFHGVPTWDNGNIDIAPECLYDDSTPYNL